ncbi:hypothetical protein ACWDNY_17625, partial [Streptomyces sp. NPDC003697]
FVTARPGILKAPTRYNLEYDGYDVDGLFVRGTAGSRDQAGTRRPRIDGPRCARPVHGMNKKGNRNALGVPVSGMSGSAAGQDTAVGHPCGTAAAPDREIDNSRRSITIVHSITDLLTPA